MGPVEFAAGLPGVKEVAGAAEHVFHQASEAGTALVDNTFQLLSDPDVNLATAEEIFRRGSVGRFKSLLSQVTRRTKDEVGETEANTILDATSTVFCMGAGSVVKNVIYKLMRCTLVAIGQADLAQTLDLWKQILTTHVKEETLQFILNHKYDLAVFLIDLIEPTKLYATAFSRNGDPNPENSHARYNPYNELDLGNAMNRHTVICQLQRLAKSLSHIYSLGTQRRSLEQLPMDTSVRSDFGDNRTVVFPPALTVRAPKRTNHHGEQWLFVNGICGEYFWLQSYCEKLRDTFKRDIRGVFNRSDGILWDLIECAGERDTDDGMQDALLQRTLSSRAAQTILNNELSAALENQNSQGPIVMIAYSQGCLLLRLVLQDFIRNNRHLNAMRARLMVFTFGNPSVDWMATHEGQRIRLCNYIKYTEHFANERDFVAQLGVLRTAQEDALRELGYTDSNSSLFINRGEDWIGHLFGTQYSMREQNYVDGRRSKLLACADGRAMAP